MDTHTMEASTTNEQPAQWMNTSNSNNKFFCNNDQHCVLFECMMSAFFLYCSFYHSLLMYIIHTIVYNILWNMWGLVVQWRGGKTMKIKISTKGWWWRGNGSTNNGWCDQWQCQQWQWWWKISVPEIQMNGQPLPIYYPSQHKSLRSKCDWELKILDPSNQIFQIFSTSEPGNSLRMTWTCGQPCVEQIEGS